MILKKIIREEINKFLIKEGIEELRAFSNALQREFQTLVNVNASVREQEVNEWVKRFIYYTVQVIHGIERCTSRNSLNEAWTDYLGIRNLPAELGGNIPYHFDKGYYWTKRNLGALMGNNNGQAPQQTNMGQYNQHNVRSVRLADSLGQINAWLGQYRHLEQKHNLPTTQPNLHKVISDIFRILNNLNTKYQQLSANQGTT